MFRLTKRSGKKKKMDLELRKSCDAGGTGQAITYQSGRRGKFWPRKEKKGATNSRVPIILGKMGKLVGRLSREYLGLEEKSGETALLKGFFPCHGREMAFVIGILLYQKRKKE